MVAGCRLWGHNEECAAEHQAGCRGDLGIEAVVEDRLRSGEAGCLGAGVEARRQVDQERHGDAEQAERKDDPSQPPALAVAQNRQSQGGGEQRDRDRQVGMGLTRRFGADRGWGCGREACVARLADLDRAVVDELGGDEASSRGEDRRADRSLGSQHGACPRSRAGGQGCGPEQHPFDHGEDAQEKHYRRTQSLADALPQASSACPEVVGGSGDRGPSALEQAVDPAIDVAGPRDRTNRRRANSFDGPAGPRPEAPSHRCYHRASLRLLFCSSFRRAREGLFHAPIPTALARRLGFP